MKAGCSMSAATEASRALAEQRFRKAEKDLLNIENNLSAEHFPAEVVCRLAPRPSATMWGGRGPF
jgi:hypothetical protein